MIPLRDTIPSRTFPVVNTALIVVNVLVFLYEVSLGGRLEGFLRHYSLVPDTVLSGISSLSLPLVMPFLTSLFLHGGWMHLAGNMLFLYIFGDNVEDTFGHVRYLFFYLACGIAASALHVATSPSSRIPTLGASGAISGVMGAYFLLFPRSRVVTLVPIFIFLQIMEIPAVVFIGLWFLLQVFYGTLSSAAGAAGAGGIAFWAHVGGFAAGALLVVVSGTLFKSRRKEYIVRT